MNEYEIQEKIEKVRERCQFDFIKLAIVQTVANKHKLKSVYGSGNRSERYLRMVLQTGKGLTGQVLKTGRQAFVKSVDKEINQENYHQYPIIMAEGLKSLGALPLFDGECVFGVVLAGFRENGKMTEEVIDKFNREVKREFCPLSVKEMVK